MSRFREAYIPLGIALDWCAKERAQAVGDLPINAIESAILDFLQARAFEAAEARRQS